MRRKMVWVCIVYNIDTNDFYKYLQEYERDHVQEAPSQKFPLEISLENDANSPCDSNWEAYEPQDNYGIVDDVVWL